MNEVGFDVAFGVVLVVVVVEKCGYVEGEQHAVAAAAVATTH